MKDATRLLPGLPPSAVRLRGWGAPGAGFSEFMRGTKARLPYRNLGLSASLPRLPAARGEGGSAVVGTETIAGSQTQTVGEKH